MGAAIEVLGAYANNIHEENVKSFRLFVPVPLNLT